MSLLRLPPHQRSFLEAVLVISVVVISLGIALSFGRKCNGLRKNLHKKDQDVLWMREARSRLERLRQRQGPRQGNTLSPVVIIDQTAGEFFLSASVESIEPETGGRVRVVMKNAPFDQTLRWLAALERQYGITVVAMTATRLPTAGMADIGLNFVRVGSG